MEAVRNMTSSSTSLSTIVLAAYCFKEEVCLYFMDEIKAFGTVAKVVSGYWSIAAARMTSRTMVMKTP